MPGGLTLASNLRVDPWQEAKISFCEEAAWQLYSPSPSSRSRVALGAESVITIRNAGPGLRRNTIHFGDDAGDDDRR